MCSGLSGEKVSFPPECVEVTVLSAGGRGSLPGPTSVTVRSFHQTPAPLCGSGQLQAAPSPSPVPLSIPACLLCLPLRRNGNNFPSSRLTFLKNAQALSVVGVAFHSGRRCTCHRSQLLRPG